MSRVRLLDLVEEHDGVRMLPHGVDEQPALLEPDVAGRRADQPCDGVLLHVLAHVEADELVAEVQRELLGELGLADAGRAGEEEAPGRTLGLSEPGARALDGARDGRDRLFLAEHDAAERLLERPQPIAIGRGGLLGRNPRHPRDDFLDVRRRDLDRLGAPTSGIDRRPLSRSRGRARSLALGAAPAGPRRFMPVLGAGLVEHVDGAVRQLVVAQVARRQLGRGLERVVGSSGRGDGLRSASAAPAGS